LSVSFVRLYSNGAIGRSIRASTAHTFDTLTYIATHANLHQYIYDTFDTNTNKHTPTHTHTHAHARSPLTSKEYEAQWDELQKTE
ncbi:MAG: hypothetical protein ACKOUU_05260, partial [Acinetobacter tjernbergiae]